MRNRKIYTSVYALLYSWQEQSKWINGRLSFAHLQLSYLFHRNSECIITQFHVPSKIQVATQETFGWLNRRWFHNTCIEFYFERKHWSNSRRVSSFWQRGHVYQVNTRSAWSKASHGLLYWQPNYGVSEPHANEFTLDYLVFVHWRVLRPHGWNKNWFWGGLRWTRWQSTHKTLTHIDLTKNW